MGQRYKAILENLRYEWAGVDVGGREVNFSRVKDYDGIIIATPTYNHLEILDKVYEFNKPILCEKPFTKDMTALENRMDYYNRKKIKLQMVDQYGYLLNHDSTGITYYDYFKHGSDGLAWDCINIIKHAEGEVHLAERSPIWRCLINGQEIDVRMMDYAYLLMLEDWINNPHNECEKIFQTHEKVKRFAEENGY